MLDPSGMYHFFGARSARPIILLRRNTAIVQNSLAIITWKGQCLGIVITAWSDEALTDNSLQAFIQTYHFASKKFLVDI